MAESLRLREYMTQKELIDKWYPVLAETRHIWSWSGDGELAYWAEQATKANVIVEIGTHYGRSAKVMLKANPLAKVYCVDPFLQDGTKHTAQHFLADEIASGRCVILPTTSDHAVAMVREQEIGMLNVDNGHEKADVERDLKAFFPRLAVGGIACGHDLDRNPDNGVTQAVKAMLPGFTEPVPRVWQFIKQKELAFA